MIRFPLKGKPRKMKGALIGPGSGPNERIELLKKMVTSLIRHERIEGRADRMHEARAYAEQLINLAIHNGDRHTATMKMADTWLLEKDLVHKLFKVVAPRYQHYSSAFTSVYFLPAKYPGTGRFEAVLELKGNPYPPVIPKQRDTRNLLTNVLLSAAGRDFYSTHEELQPSEMRDSVLMNDLNNVNQTSDSDNQSMEAISDHITPENMTENQHAEKKHSTTSEQSSTNR